MRYRLRCFFEENIIIVEIVIYGQIIIFNGCFGCCTGDGGMNVFIVGKEVFVVLVVTDWMLLRQV